MSKSGDPLTLNRKQCDLEGHNELALGKSSESVRECDVIYGAVLPLGFRTFI